MKVAEQSPSEQVEQYRKLAKSSFALVNIYKGLLGFTVLVLLSSIFYNGYQFYRSQSQQQENKQLKQGINNALYEVRHGSMLEADRFLTETGASK